MNEDVVATLGILVLAGFVSALCFTTYLWRVYLTAPRTNGGSRVLRDWCVVSTVVLSATSLVAYPAYLAATHQPRAPWTGLALVAALLLSFTVPTYLGIRVWWYRRQHP